MFVIQSDLQGQNVNSKVKISKNIIFNQIIQIAASVIPIFYVIFSRESICGDSFGESKDILNIKNVNSKIRI